MALEIHVEKWTKAEVKGNAECPDCGGKLIVIASFAACYAFCPNCREYYVDNETIERTIKILDALKVEA